MGWVLDLADKTWPITRRLMAGHTAVYKATNGLVGHTAPGLPTMLLLEHVGAKSGKKRVAPLLYMADGDRIVVIASKGGYTKHPGWFHNLMANPDTEVELPREGKVAVHARKASPEERAELWPRMVEQYGEYETYQRSTPREIPVVVLDRV